LPSIAGGQAGRTGILAVMVGDPSAATTATAPTRRALRSLRRLLLFGGSLYLAWWFVVQAVLPGSYNALGGRLVVVAAFYVMLAASFLSEWMRRHLEEGLIACIWLLTIHYYYLFYRNGGDAAWAVGAYVVVVGGSALLSSRQSLFAYSLLTIAMATLVSFADRSLLHSIFLPGLATMAFLSNLTLRNRLLLEEERSQLTQAKAAHAAAEADVALRDEFISIASHELNTPLATLKLSFKQFSRAVVPGGEPVSLEAVQRSLERCERQLVRLIRLVDALLDASRIAAGGMALRVENVCLLETVRDAVQALAVDAARVGSQIEVAGDATVSGQWDPTRMEQLVTNLLRNALVFGRGLPIRVTVTGDASKARLSVVDQGIGIAREQQVRIFGRFQRAVSAQHYGGLGLGLYVVKQVVDAHGGSVHVDSKPGSGATFTVELPRARIDPAATTYDERPFAS
jgi:signal transduction histidine kinase